VNIKSHSGVPTDGKHHCNTYRNHLQQPLHKLWGQRDSDALAHVVTLCCKQFRLTGVVWVHWLTGVSIVQVLVHWGSWTSKLIGLGAHKGWWRMQWLEKSRGSLRLCMILHDWIAQPGHLTSPPSFSRMWKPQVALLSELASNRSSQPNKLIPIRTPQVQWKWFRQALSWDPWQQGHGHQRTQQERAVPLTWSMF